MKIPLRLGPDGPGGSTVHAKVSEQEILAVKQGDWTARGNLAKTFGPLLTTLAHKRSSDPVQIGELIEAGKEGLFKAAKHYKPSVGAARFQMFALDFIEAGMNRALKKSQDKFFSRLFSRKK